MMGLRVIGLELQANTKFHLAGNKSKIEICKLNG
jgi:hypothetical protein